MNYSIWFLDQDDKTKLVPASFLTFYNSYVRKIDFSLKSVIVITIMISLHKETNLHCFNLLVLFTLLL